jgi:hypothetical protein
MRKGSGTIPWDGSAWICGAKLFSNLLALPLGLFTLYRRKSRLVSPHHERPVRGTGGAGRQKTIFASEKVLLSCE